MGILKLIQLPKSLDLEVSTELFPGPGFYILLTFFVKTLENSHVSTKPISIVFFFTASETIPRRKRAETFQLNEIRQQHKKCREFISTLENTRHRSDVYFS